MVGVVSYTDALYSIRISPTRFRIGRELEAILQMSRKSGVDAVSRTIDASKEIVRRKNVRRTEIDTKRMYHLP